MEKFEENENDKKIAECHYGWCEVDWKQAVHTIEEEEICVQRYPRASCESDNDDRETAGKLRAVCGVELTDTGVLATTAMNDSEESGNSVILVATDRVGEQQSDCALNAHTTQAVIRPGGSSRRTNTIRSVLIVTRKSKKRTKACFQIRLTL